MSARLLSAIRATTEIPGEGRADSSGFYWHARSGASRLSVTAHEDSRGTQVQVHVNRASALFLTLYVSLLGIVIPPWMLIESVLSYPELLALFAIPTAVLVATRMFWKSSTRSIRERTAVLLEAVREAAGRGDDEGGTQDG